jgi:xylan 1,4-beta-xylosidase
MPNHWMTRAARSLRVALLPAVLAGLSLARAQVPATSADPRFEWFAYEGHDPIYDRTKAGPNEYLNPILTGFHPDPSIVRRGDDFYLVTSSFSYFPGIPIFHSQDLVHWTQLGHVLDRPSQLKLDSAGISRGIFAPVIREHAGTFYMITTIADGGNLIVTAKDPAGPWSDPIWLPEVNGKDGYDPSLFFDDDGKAYVVNNGPPIGKPLYDGHRAIWIQQFDVATKKMVGPRAVIVNGGVDLTKKPVWIEAPHIFKRDGKYFLICAEGGTADQHSEVVFRADSPMGPYKPGPINPILTQRHLDPNRPFPITSTGHADFVQTKNGDWWAVFLGVRPYGDNLYNTGRETFLLPARWTNGWPMILDSTQTVPYVHERPNLPVQPVPPIPLSGNFTVRDDFTSPTLAPYWEFIRTPREGFFHLSPKPGFLQLKARPAQIGTRAQLSFVGRRQQHINASASTAMYYVPVQPGDVAGLAAFQTDDFFYLLGVTLVRGKPVVQLVERDGRMATHEPVVLASAPIVLSPDKPIYLKIVARGDKYDFLYGTTKDAWTPLKTNADGTILSTKVAGGFSSNFVGAMFGMYAYSPTR